MAPRGAFGVTMALTERGRARLLRGVLLAVTLALLGYILARGWVSDDAASMAAGSSSHRVPLALGLGATASFLVLLIRCARSSLAALCGLVTLAASRAFVDCSTGGYENALGNVLLLLLVAGVPRARAGASDVLRIALGVALLALIRVDLLLLGVPVLALTCYLAARSGLPLRRIALGCVLGQLPLFACELFSLVDDGSWLPNAATLNSGMDALTSAGLGWRYYLETLLRDPWTLVALPALLGHAVRFRASPLPIALGLGVLVDLAYVLSLGGGALPGRAFVAPLACCVALIVSRHVQEVAGSDWRLLGGALAVGSLCALRPLTWIWHEPVRSVSDARSQEESRAVRALVAGGGSGLDNVGCGSSARTAHDVARAHPGKAR